MNPANRPLRAACLAIVAIAGWAGFVSAQPPARQTFYTRDPVIRRFNFTPDTSGRLKKVLLYVSANQGRDWQMCSEASPTDGFFRDYSLPGDGTYWFAIRSLDAYDRYNPASLADLPAERVIVVDTRPPVVSLRQIDERRPGIGTIEWDVRDENLNLSKLTLEYRVPGVTDWQRFNVTQPGTTGTASWNIDPGVRMEARLRVADLAGNAGEAVLSVALGSSGGSTSAGPSASHSGSTPVYLRSRTIRIPFRLTVGISGIKDLELWYTKDNGRQWVKAPKQGQGLSSAESPGAPVDRAMLFEADTDGPYGFIIVVRNGVGVGDPDPRPGDPPTHSVVVDTVVPKLQLVVTPGTGPDMRNVTIRWAADDASLADQPVTLEYAEVKDAPPADTDWKPLPSLPGAQGRSGTYVWTITNNEGSKFLIRATATDKAGNKTVETTKDPIIVDLQRPRVEVIGIEAGSPKPP